MKVYDEMGLDHSNESRDLKLGTIKDKHMKRGNQMVLPNLRGNQMVLPTVIETQS